MSSKYLFGPVPSRRLGLSLGIDLVPHKTCSLNCVYCECGKTTLFTTERKEYIPLENLKNELKNFLNNDPAIDFLTLTGSGEPTLYSRIGDLIDFLKDNYKKYKIALLTNSTILNDKKLQDEIIKCDVILPSLDAISEDVFSKINDPAKNLKSKDLLDGLLDFKNKFPGKMWVEIFIIPGVNDNDKELELFKKYLLELKPDKVQLNSLDRPGVESWVKKASYESLAKIKSFFYPIECEIVAKYDQATRTYFEDENVANKIISIITRRPCTLEDISAVTGMSNDQIEKHLQNLIANKKIETTSEERGIFYKTAK